MTLTTISYLNQLKSDGCKFAALTAYDFCFARLFSNEGIQVLLIGDSLGMTIQGHDSTLPVTIKDMVYHIAAVRRGAPQALIIADMPFMSYATLQKTFKNAAQLIQAGSNVVKLEGGAAFIVDTVRMLTERAVPVCGHLGLTPQSVNILGGYKIQGRSEASAQRLLADAQALEAAGAKLLVLECVPISLAECITKSLSIPVIGIGAGNVTDGQILVMHDAFGFTNHNTPKFVKNFLAETGNIRTAIHQYIAEVKAETYPAIQHSFE
ncbi:3-methyl-2-oxobutanoate hydroxymethyltransferase [Candidatus Pantoea carbekii]|uniref:3-methyl-2-oxobutanoate hydroxymethyltransferase n=1 Tax=Candidatus Pantoea carbekii TaxID=1235990 RepID=UPI0006187B73|nr:3-methyl-2-oxobutanoate hydroxymethyltransferase [Candidatus Pantoea carbekii]AKC31911.1 3-methyl-2-oxobutanoate hydroxymethyltransferase [Candidatus Pantoea carbekii]